MTTLLYLTDEWIKIITETAHDIAKIKGWATRVSANDVIPVIMALYILKAVMKKK